MKNIDLLLFIHTIQVKYEKVLEYLTKGVGSPPHCELSLKAASDDITPPDLVLDITLSGVSGPCSRLKIIRKAEKPGQLLIVYYFQLLI